MEIDVLLDFDVALFDLLDAKEEIVKTIDLLFVWRLHS